MRIRRKAKGSMKGGTIMRKTIRARFSKGVIKPLEKVDLREGEDIIVSIAKAPFKRVKKSFSDGLKKTAGAWKDLVDCDELIRNIYADRLSCTRQ